MISSFMVINILLYKILDFLRKVDSDFPYAKQRTRKSYMIKSIIESLPEMVEEEKNEEEEVIFG